MNTPKYFLIIIILINLFSSCVKNSQTNIDSNEIKSVETNLIPPIYIIGDSTWTIESRMKHYGVPGVSIAVIQDYKIAWIKSYGIADKESQKPVTKQTIFLAGSISKSVAAYGALKLVEENKISLNENVNTFLKSWQVPKNKFTTQKKVTLKNILTHTGGITVDGFLGYDSESVIPTLLEILDGVEPANSQPIVINNIPGEDFNYSGGGYTVMQQMMIDIEQKPFPNLMNELVLNPLDMSNSTFNQPLSESQSNIAATGYLEDGSMVKGKRFIYPEMAAAGLWTTAEDLAKFVVDIQNTLKNNDSNVLSKSMTNKMLTPFFEGGGPALGVFISESNDETYFSHNGWIQGFCSEFTANKDNGYGVVVLINANQPEFVSELIRSVGFTYDWDNFITKYQKIKMKPNEIQNITGRYRSEDDNIIEIYNIENRLFRKNLDEKPIELFKISDTSYVSREDGDKTVQFKLNPKQNNYDMFIRYNSGYLISSLSKIGRN